MSQTSSYRADTMPRTSHIRLTGSITIVRMYSGSPFCSTMPMNCCQLGRTVPTCTPKPAKKKNEKQMMHSKIWYWM